MGESTLLLFVSLGINVNIMFLNTKEVAKKFGCTTRNIALMVKAGKLTPVNSHKDFFLFDANEIDLLTSKKLSDAKQ